jgi:(S)-3,5-dihydroxyphenylglycine transaminase
VLPAGGLARGFGESSAGDPMAMEIDLKRCFSEPLLEVMNFLNEVVLRYPRAVSFAPGRPAEVHFDVAASLDKVARFVEHRAAATGASPAAVYNDLGQYNRTNGIINDLIARQLAADEGIRADAASIVVTSGCQEGMAILLAGLFDPARDVLLVSDPTYIGITGLARILGIRTVAVPSGPRGLDAAAVEAAIEEVEAAGSRARALYDIPDFNNPMGTRMPLAARRGLLDMARRRGVLIFEDNPYGMFCYEGEPLPTLKALDEQGVVVYLGSFSKTLFPGLRLGYLIADQEVAADREVAATAAPAAPATPATPQNTGRTSLASELSKVKSLTTVNTSPLLQAVAGAILLENGGSLRPLMRRKLPFYRANRDRMLACLGARLAGVASWNRPDGGFFLTVDLPFEFDADCLETCARDFGVICCPMSFFALTPGRERQIRLSFSYVTEEQIEEGIARLARFVRGRAGVRDASALGGAARGRGSDVASM